jgi:hypothetical protein
LPAESTFVDAVFDDEDSSIKDDGIGAEFGIDNPGYC